MFLNEPMHPEAAEYLEHERASTGYVMNSERAWAWRPDLARAFSTLRGQLAERSSLSRRELAVLVCATARVQRDSCCAYAWGTRLADLAGADVASRLLRTGATEGLDAREAALATWAARIAQDANATAPTDVDELRSAGLDDREIFEATLFVAWRIAFATVNDALGARPDAELVARAPREVRAAIDYGRPPAP